MAGRVELDVGLDGVPAILIEEAGAAIDPVVAITVVAGHVGVVDVVADRAVSLHWVAVGDDRSIGAAGGPAVGAIHRATPPTGDSVGAGDPRQLAPIGRQPVLAKAKVIAEIGLVGLVAGLVHVFVDQACAVVVACGHLDPQRGPDEGREAVGFGRIDDREVGALRPARPGVTPARGLEVGEELDRSISFDPQITGVVGGDSEHGRRQLAVEPVGGSVH